MAGIQYDCTRLPAEACSGTTVWPSNRPVPRACFEFEVADNGVGFQPDRHADGMGLVSMRDRIAAVGGELKVDSSPGRGTVVSGSVPVALEPVADSPERELGS